MRKEKEASYSYIESIISQESDLKQKARGLSEELGLEGISISPTEARIIQFFVQQKPRRKIVEIGTLTGLSALYFLEALTEDGQLWTLEKSELHAEKASEVLKDDIRAGRCHLVVGDAREKLNEISAQGPFDAIFIDGNKAAYMDYWNWAQAHISVGGVILVDNIFLSGSVWGDTSTQKFSEKQIRIVDGLNKAVSQNEAFNSIIVPTTEGLLVAVKKG